MSPSAHWRSSRWPCHRQSLTRHGVSAGVSGLDGDQDRGLHGPRAKDDSAHVFAGVSWGYLVQPQQGAMGLNANGEGSEGARAVQSNPSSRPALGDCCTWCRVGRLPPRLCQVTWAWACPGTTQFRSRVCPSATWEEEDSMRMGWEPPRAGPPPGAGAQRGWSVGKPFWGGDHALLPHHGQPDPLFLPSSPTQSSRSICLDL